MTRTTGLSLLVRAAMATAIAGLWLYPAPAAGFCGFYVSGAGADMFNNATQVVLMREGKRTVLSMQNNYQGPPENFAMVVPVPQVLQEENVKTLSNDIFDRVDKLAAPRLVEYWEQNPCALPMRQKADTRVRRRSGAAPARPQAEGSALGVTIEAQFEVGEYEIVILSAKDSAGLDTWLRQEKYQIPAGAEPLLRPYVQTGSKFFVAKVNSKKVKFIDGQATLSPLRFYYDSDEFSLPVRLGMINSSGTQDLIVHILARGQRYQVANYKNATIPTNLDLKDEAKARFGEFYAALFDRTLDANPGAVVTEYSWDASTCDPCPTPALRHNELATLGYDVLNVPMPSGSKPADQGKPKDAVDELLAKPQQAPPARRSRRPPRPFPGGFVLTRLHARYGKGALGDDLVFTAAPPIAGGREVRQAGGKLEEAAVPARINNFQARYAIRHAWTGPIECENPRRGIWGAPPDGRPPQPRPAQELAFAPRGKVALTSFVSGEVPGLPSNLLSVVSAQSSPPASSLAATAADTPAAAGSAANGAEPDQASSSDDGNAAEGSSPDLAKSKTSKGCHAGSNGDGGAGQAAVVLLALALGAGLRRRQRGYGSARAADHR